MRIAPIHDDWTDAMHTLALKVLDYLDYNGVLMVPCGSRVICPATARPDSDYDIAVLGSRDFVCELMNRLTITFEDNQPNKKSASLRVAQLNLLVFFDGEQFAKFAAATYFCVDVPRFHDKERRLKYFDYDVFGETSISAAGRLAKLAGKVEWSLTEKTGTTDTFSGVGLTRVDWEKKLLHTMKTANP